MKTKGKFIHRNPAEVDPWAETCGSIRCLIEESDEAAAEVHHVEIQDAKLHSSGECFLENEAVSWCCGKLALSQCGWKR